jgi:hypothetical protein
LFWFYSISLRNREENHQFWSKTAPMLKHLPVFVLIIFFFTAANAQTLADSVEKRSPVGSLAKRSLVDSIVKHQPVDSTARYSPVKKVVKHHSEGDAAEHSPIKTLNDLRYTAYIKGRDQDDMALVAELNHYPHPEKVLLFKKELSLSPIQVAKISTIAAELHRKKVEMGGFIIHNEKMLDSLFHTRLLDNGIIIFYANRSGLYYGELRNAILQACYSTEKNLTNAQIKKLEALQKEN